jgi:acyl carrier protein
MDAGEIRERVLSVLTDFVADWGVEERITPASRIVEDLEFDSIDVIQLTVALERELGSRKIGFQDLLMRDGRYVDDLSVGQIQEFLVRRFSMMRTQAVAERPSP